MTKTEKAEQSRMTEINFQAFVHDVSTSPELVQVKITPALTAAARLQRNGLLCCP